MVAKLPIMDDIYHEIVAEYGEYDPTYWQRGEVTVTFACNKDFFNTPEDVQFAIRHILFDRFEGLVAEVILK